MTNELTIFRNGFVPSTAFKNIPLPKTRLDEGTGGAPFARISYKSKDWAIRNGAQSIPLMRTVDGRPEKNPNLDIVILNAANHPSRRWFKDGYTDGSNNAPDCYSTGGFKPDAGAALKQDSGQGCLLCPHSGWGSKPGSKGKACSEYKNLAIVPVGDIENKINGGPMLLAIPPNSLKALSQYQLQLEANTLHYAMVHTRITFAEGLFQFGFDALAVLDDVQADQVGRMLQHPMIGRILDEEVADMPGDSPPQRTNVHVLKAVAAPTEPAPAKPAAVTPVQAQPTLTPEQQEIAALKAQLAAAKAPPEPELTPEQKEIAELKAQLAAAAQAKAQPGEGTKTRGRPRGTPNRTPAVAPTNMDSEVLTEKPVETMAKDLPVPGNDAEDPLASINRTLSKAKELI